MILSAGQPSLPVSSLFYTKPANISLNMENMIQTADISTEYKCFHSLTPPTPPRPHQFKSKHFLEWSVNKLQVFSHCTCVCSCETLILLFLCSLKAFVVMNVCLNRQVSCSVYSQPALRDRNQLLTAITQTSSHSENLYEQSES